MDEHLLMVQVIYGPPPPAIPIIIILHVATGSTVSQVIDQSGIAEQLPDFDLSQCKVGIWGKVRPLDTVIESFARIEIYRPLIADPKDARRRRASKG